MSARTLMLALGRKRQGGAEPLPAALPSNSLAAGRGYGERESEEEARLSRMREITRSAAVGGWAKDLCALS